MIQNGSETCQTIDSETREPYKQTVALMSIETEI